mgnify:FL=1
MVVMVMILTRSSVVLTRICIVHKVFPNNGEKIVTVPVTLYVKSSVLSLDPIFYNNDRNFGTNYLENVRI